MFCAYIHTKFTHCITTDIYNRSFVLKFESNMWSDVGDNAGLSFGSFNYVTISELKIYVGTVAEYFIQIFFKLMMVKWTKVCCWHRVQGGTWTDIKVWSCAQRSSYGFLSADIWGYI